MKTKIFKNYTNKFKQLGNMALAIMESQTTALWLVGNLAVLLRVKMKIKFAVVFSLIVLSIAVSATTQAQSAYDFNNPDPNWVFWDDFERVNMRDVASGYPWCYNMSYGNAADPTDDAGTDYWPSYPASSAIDITSLDFYSGMRSARVRYLANDTGSNARTHLNFSSTKPGELGLAQIEEMYVRYLVKFPAGWVWNNGTQPREMHVVMLNAGNFVPGSLSEMDLTLYQEYHVGPGVSDTQHYAEMTYVSDLQDKSQIMLPNPYNTYNEYRSFPNVSDIAFTAGRWYEVQSYVKLNSFTNNIPNTDGRVKLWIRDAGSQSNPQLAVDVNSLVLRDANHQNIKFHHLLIGPNLPPSGVAVAQDSYIDGLVISRSYITLGSRLGDLNLDGKVNIADIQLCINVILKTETDPGIVARADVNKDTKVNIADIQQIINIILTP